MSTTRTETPATSDQSSGLEAIRGIAPLDDILLAASAKLRPDHIPPANCHIHLPPNFSAFDTASAAVGLAADQGVSVLGANNYYDYSVYVEFAAACRKHAVFPLFGIEIIALIDEFVQSGVKINDPGNPGKIYVCGKGITRFDDFTPVAASILRTIRGNDSTRIRDMIAKLARTLADRGCDTGLNEDAIIGGVVRRHGSGVEQVCLQERHVCQAFQEALFDRIAPAGRAAKIAALLGLPSATFDDSDAVKVQNDIRSSLLKSGKPAYLPETFVSYDQAHTLVLELGGIPCYPVLADGAKPITPFESPVGGLIDNVRKLGIHAIEFIPNRNAPSLLREYVQTIRAAGVVVTAGTEHNTLESLPILPECLGGEPLPTEVDVIFREGACVIAGHQFLTLHGENGYVLRDGTLNPAYSDPDTRINAFAAIGAAAVAKYRQQYSKPA